MYEKEKKLIEAFEELEKAIGNFELLALGFERDRCLSNQIDIFLEEHQELREAMVITIAAEHGLQMMESYTFPKMQVMRCEVGACIRCPDYLLAKEKAGVDENGELVEVEIHTCFKHLLDAVELLKNS